MKRIVKVSQSSIRFIAMSDDEDIAVSLSVEADCDGDFVGYSLTYHKEPPEMADECMVYPCDILPGKECYGDGSWETGRIIFSEWVAKGEVDWKTLDEMVQKKGESR